MRFSYGTNIAELFDPDNHEEHRKYTSTLDGEVRWIMMRLFGKFLFIAA
jgi:hypothetical protein